MTQPPGTLFHTSTVPAGAYSLDYAEAGPDQPAATIVSLPGSAGLEMSVAKDTLSRRYRVVEINPPGWGERDDVSTPMHQSELGPLLVKAIEQLVDGSFYLIGTSMSGANALYVAALLPDRVQGVVTEGGMVPIEPTEDLRIPPPVEPGSEYDYPVPDPDPRKPWAGKEYIRHQMKNRMRMFQWLEQDWTATAEIATIANRRIPVMALLGDQDDILNPGQEQRFREHLPHARFHLLPGGGHDLQNTVPEQFVALVEEFVTETR